MAKLMRGKNILILLFLIIGFLGWRGIYLPKNPASEKEIIFNIEKGQGSKEIALNLEKENLIRRAPLFWGYVFLQGVSGKLQAGIYQLSPSMNIPEIVEKLANGEVVKIKVTIPEGYTIKQIQEKVNHTFNVTTSDVVTLKVGDFNEEFDFLKNISDEAPLEGFLFPDTYQVTYGIKTREIIRIMLGNFNKKLTADLREEIETQGKTIFEIVTMASLIEREVRTFEDRVMVSGILWKRLKAGIPLQVDATITYITGGKTTKISKENTLIDSPYNTYMYRGLPAGPISNPGLEGIKAALYPKDSAYLYYLSTPAAEGEPRPNGREGETIFSKTLEEHNIAKAKYLK